jgi:hypothetical protein
MPEPVPLTPHMDEEGLACFKNVLATSKCYLEYGSGGSTIYANNNAEIDFILSVESDPRWAKAVAASLVKNRSKTLVAHCDIGEVGDWGNPTDKQRMDSFWRYMVTPWELAKQRNLVPDTVLIDGRFRVASFLFSLLSSRTGTTILFDDYLDRPQYFVVEEFCRLESKHGRMGLFVSAHNYSTVEIAKKIAQYSVVPA